MYESSKVGYIMILVIYNSIKSKHKAFIGFVLNNNDIVGTLYSRLCGTVCLLAVPAPPLPPAFWRTRSSWPTEIFDGSDRLFHLARAAGVWLKRMAMRFRVSPLWTR